MVSKVHINIRKRLEVAFGVRRRSAGCIGGGGAKVAVGCAVNLHRLVGPLEEHGVRLVLMPLEAATFAVHTNVKVVFLAHRNLRTVQHALGSAGETEQHIAIIIEFTSTDKCGEICSELLDFQAGDVLCKVLGVRADVPDAAGGTASLRVRAPAGLFLAGQLQPSGEPALRVLDDDLANLAELAGGDHVTRFFHERVAGVIMGKAIEALAFFYELLERLGLPETEGGGLVAQHVEAVLHRHLGRRKMHVVRRDDGHEIHSILRRQCSLSLDHLLKCAVTAFGREEEIPAAGFGFSGAGRKRAAHQLDLAIHVCGNAMHPTDESAAAAADHSVTNFSAHNFGLNELIY